MVTATTGVVTFGDREMVGEDVGDVAWTGVDVESSLWSQCYGERDWVVSCVPACGGARSEVNG